VGPRGALDGCGKSRHHRDSIPDRPDRSQSLYRLSYRATIKVLLGINYEIYRNTIYVQRNILTYKNTFVKMCDVINNKRHVRIFTLRS